jgi:methyl-accepting chemotaxis protein
MRSTRICGPRSCEVVELPAIISGLFNALFTTICERSGAQIYCDFGNNMPKRDLQRIWAHDRSTTSGANNSDFKTLQSRHRRLPRLGVSAKLQLAFGAVVGLTVLAAAVGFVSFSAIKGGLQHVVNHQMPTMTNAMRLSVISGSISAAAARFISAKTDDDRRATVALMAQKSADLTASIAAERQEIGENQALMKVLGLSQSLAANLAALEDAISQRNRLREQIEEMLDGLHQTHAQVIEELTRLPDSTQALEVAAGTHLLVSLISEGSAVHDPSAFTDIQYRLKAATSSLKQAVSRFDNENMRGSLSVDKVRDKIEQLSRFSQGADSIFARRARELFANTSVDAAIDENVAIQRELDSAVAILVNEAEVRTQADAAKLISNLEISGWLLLLVVAVSLLAAGGIGIFYVHRHLVRRLIAIGLAMRRLASGHVDIGVPPATEPDEIGEMARALEVFRSSEIDRRNLSDREHSDQDAQRARARTIEQIIAEFRATVTDVIGSVAENVARMEATARSLSTIARNADQQARAVSLSSEATSTNVRTVAGAADQLGVSIHEINKKAMQVHAVAKHATETAHSTDQLVNKLSIGTTRIGDVIKLIHTIAEQTNLLALNATIEAARAGDAGRGFNVVATEVKALATQTAKATEEIAAQIGSIQDLTKNTVAAIRSIRGVMDDISGFTAAIASAVDRQMSSTQMIAQNVQEAATGAGELAAKIASVTEAIDETSRSAAVVHETSQAFSAQASTLDREVDKFLGRVSAA